MFFGKLGIIYGHVMSLEGLRRNQVGGTMLAVFLELDSDIPLACPPKLEYLRTLNTIMESLISDLPAPMSYVASPFMDYLSGCE